MTPVFSEPSFINPGTRFQGTKDCEVYIKIDNEDDELLSEKELKTSAKREVVVYDDVKPKITLFFCK